MTTRFQAPPFMPLTPEEEVYERQRCRFLKVPFEPEVNHRIRCWVAFKNWEWNLKKKLEAIQSTSAVDFL